MPGGSGASGDAGARIARGRGRAQAARGAAGTPCRGCHVPWVPRAVGATCGAYLAPSGATGRPIAIVQHRWTARGPIARRVTPRRQGSVPRVVQADNGPLRSDDRRAPVQHPPPRIPPGVRSTPGRPPILDDRTAAAAVRGWERPPPPRARRGGRSDRSDARARRPAGPRRLARRLSGPRRPGTRAPSGRNPAPCSASASGGGATTSG